MEDQQWHDDLENTAQRGKPYGADDISVFQENGWTVCIQTFMTWFISKYV